MRDDSAGYQVPTRFPLSRIAIAFVIGVLLVVGAVLAQQALTPPDPEADLLEATRALDDGRLRGDDGVFALLDNLEAAETDAQHAAREALRVRALEALLEQAETQPREEALNTLEFAESKGADPARLESLRERFIIIEPSLSVSPTELSVGGELAVTFRVPADATEVIIALVAGTRSLTLETEVSSNDPRSRRVTTTYVFRSAGTYVLRARYVLGQEHIELSEAVTVSGGARRHPAPTFRPNPRPSTTPTVMEPPRPDTAEPWVDEPDDEGIDWSLPSGGSGGSGGGTTASPWTGDG